MQISFLESENNFLNYIIGKTGLYFFLFLTYLFFTFLVVFPLLDISINGNLFSLFAVSSIFLLATVLYSWFISSFFTSETRAMEVFALTSYPIFLITGVTWSVNEMPLFIQLISNLIPLNPYFVFLKKLVVMGVNSYWYLNEIIHLLILVFIGFIAAYLRFCYLQKKHT